MTTRSREILPRVGKVDAHNWRTATIFGTPVVIEQSNFQSSYKFTGTQVTASEGHPFKSHKGLGDVGGPFHTTKSYIANDFVTQKIDFSIHVGGFGDPTDHVHYHGPILPIGPGSNGKFPFPPAHSSSEEEMNAHGATAISIANPENALVNLSTTLGETIKDGLPHLMSSRTWEGRTKRAQQAGDAYLSAQFGWLPLVRDVSGFANVVSNADAVLAQYERDAGKQVRRRVELSSTEDTDESVQTAVSPWTGGSGGNFIASSGTRTLRRSITQRRWFSGAFVYYLPTGYDSRNKMDRYALLAQRLGLDVKPDLLWNLAPWSWAVDWFTNAGDVVNNVSSIAVDGTVLSYGYIMEHTVVRDTYTMTGISDYTGAQVNVQPLTLVTETKVRYGANPYGFGVTWEGLSSTQAAILAALGITQGRR